MSRVKKKIYQSGDQINLRLSKSRVTQDVIKAINEANEKGRLNEFALSAFEFFVKLKNGNDYMIIDQNEHKTVDQKSKTKKEEKVNLIKENYEKNDEDEIFDNNVSESKGKNGLNRALSSLRRK